MRHLSALQLCAFLDDALMGTPDDQTARHLGSCALCRDRYEAWCHVDDALREMLGQVPDEHAMEQRSSWVEIAVTADRKGLPAPEFAELRLPLHPVPQPAPPPAAYPSAWDPAPPRSLVPPPAASQYAPPPTEYPYAPPPAAPPWAAHYEAPYTPEPAYPPAPPQAPIGHVTVTSTPPAHGATRFSLREQPAPVSPMPGAERYARSSAATESSAAPQPPGYRVRAYARMPKAPPRGLAALVRRPVSWVTLILLVAVAIALPYAHPELGMPRIPLPWVGSHAGAATTADTPDPAPVSKPAADGDKGGARSTPPVVPANGKHAHTTEPPAASPTESPDASILFDLPAIEPEDDEPDPATTSPGSDRSATQDPAAGSEKPMLCGEVRSSQGAPIEGAKVTLSSPTMVVRTDRHGRFCVACPPGKHTIRIESVGRAPIMRVVSLGREKLETRFTLDASN